MAKKIKSKKAKFDQTEKSSSGLIVAAIIGLGVLVLGGFIFFGGSKSSEAFVGKEISERYLTENYEIKKVTDPVDYTTGGSIQMTDIANEVNGDSLEFKLSDVIKNKIVLTKYEEKQVDSNVGTTGLPIMAWITPAGKMEVAVSFCPPCNGIKHSIESDGTLTCATCGTKRDPETDAGISGACRLYPSDKLPVTVEGDTIKISKSVLDSWTPQEIDTVNRPVGG